MKMSRKVWVKRMIWVIGTAVLILVMGCGIFFGAAAVTGRAEIEPFYDENGDVLEGSVAERCRIQVGDRENGLIIRGKSVDNPVLLFISGGPGVPQYWLNEYYPNKLEEDFTVCWWDWAGEGLSYDSSIKKEDITTKRLEADASQVADYLKERFGKDKVYLMAHSGGSKLGFRLAQDDPEDFYCYFAMGQAVSKDVKRYQAGYDFVKKTFEEQGNKKGLKRLESLITIENGQPIAKKPERIGSDWEGVLLMAGCATTREMRSDAREIFFPQMLSKCYTFGEKIDYWRGKMLNRDTPYDDDDISYKDEHPVQIPVCFISGKYDYTCPVNMVEKLYENLDAPEKELYIFEDSAHSPLWEENDQVLEVMREKVEKLGQ